MAHILVVCCSSNVRYMLVLAHDGSEILKDLRHGVCKTSFKSTLLVMTAQNDLIQLDEQVFIKLLVGTH